MNATVLPPTPGPWRTGRAALRVFAWLTVLAMVLSGVLVAALAAWASDAADAGWFSRTVIDIDGARFHLAQLQGEQWLLAAVVVFLALVAAILVAVLVVPVAVLVPLAVAALAGAAVVLSVAAVGALLLSPLILLGWAMWRLSRPRPGVATIAP